MVDSGNKNLNINSTVKLNNGEHIPVFGLGTWRSEPGKVEAAVKAALLLGYKHLDCAYAYENHKEVAEGIKDAQKENSSLKREDIWITSKLWNNSHNPSRVEKQVDEILSDLNTKYLDLLLIHWPVSWEVGDKLITTDEKDIKPDTSHTEEETWRALEALVSKGKVKSLGISNYTEQQVEETLKFAKIKPVVNQVESHPYMNNDALKKFCEERDIRITAYSPLGNVAGKIDESPLKHPTILEISKRHNKSPAQVIIRWHLQKGNIVIPKSSSPDRVKENAQVFDFQLTEEDIQAINKLDKGPSARQVNPTFWTKEQKGPSRKNW